MSKVEKAIEELARRLQDVLWELEGEADEVAGGAAGSGGLTAALQQIHHIEATKLRVEEARQAARRLHESVPEHTQQVLSLIYAEISTAEFAAKGALQNRQLDLIGKLIDDGYAQARSKTYQPLEDILRQLRVLAEAAKPHHK